MSALLLYSIIVATLVYFLHLIIRSTLNDSIARFHIHKIDSHLIRQLLQQCIDDIRTMGSNEKLIVGGAEDALYHIRLSYQKINPPAINELHLLYGFEVLYFYILNQ